MRAAMSLSLRIGPQLKTMIDAAQTEVFMTSPYFVPGDTGTKFLSALAQRGVTTQILTNLARGDRRSRRAFRICALPAHAARRRSTALRIAPDAAVYAQPVTSSGTSSGVSLHAKTLVVDRKQVFIGSLNMDQRSKLLEHRDGRDRRFRAARAGGTRILRHGDPASPIPSHVVLQESPGSQLGRQATGPGYGLR